MRGRSVQRPGDVPPALRTARTVLRGAVRRGRLPAVVLVLLLTTVAAPAHAHDGLLGSEPGDGSTVTASPTQVVLTFSGDQLAVGSALAVTDADGGSWSAGEPAVSGATVTQPLSDELPAGRYDVRWRSVAGDGHPVEGTFSFTVEVPGEQPDEPAASATPDPVAAPTEDAEVQPAPTDDDAAPRAQADAGAPSTGPGRWLAAGAGAAALAGAVMLARRGRR